MRGLVKMVERWNMLDTHGILAGRRVPYLAGLTSKYMQF